MSELIEYIFIRNKAKILKNHVYIWSGKQFDIIKLFELSPQIYVIWCKNMLSDIFFTGSFRNIYMAGMKIETAHGRLCLFKWSLV